MTSDTSMEKLLACYPFADPRIKLVEGFSAYDGAIGDEPGKPHRGIDYVLYLDGIFRSFDIYAMHDGIAFQGKSDSWGTFVLLHLERDGVRYRTVYGHLDTVDPDIAPQFIEQNGQRIVNTAGTPLQTGHWLGRAGMSGWTNHIIQLHLELHQKDLVTDHTEKLDPYGVYDQASSGKYPQPGDSLRGLTHAWMTDEPPFAPSS